MDEVTIKKLINAASKARENSYAPYSDFYVGAALLTCGGQIFTGCNIENASYSPSNCAERTAFFKAVSEGEKEFEAIAVCGGNKGVCGFCPPCGVCLQVMAEFCDAQTFTVILSDGKQGYKTYLLKELLPVAFKFNNE